jgi:uncharacterized membrane protein
MLNKKRAQITSVFFGVITLLCSFSTSAQCAMCRASLESEGNTTKAESLNDGIVYLMVIPYFLVGIVAYIIYRMFYKKKNNTEVPQ